LDFYIGEAINKHDFSIEFFSEIGARSRINFFGGTKGLVKGKKKNEYNEILSHVDLPILDFRICLYGKEEEC
jgi:hypothetical protein